MRESRIYRALRSMANDDSGSQALCVHVDDIYDESVELMKTVPLYMRQYTLHDKVHINGVIDLMGRLLPNETFRCLGPLELASLILSSALHDIGMVASEDEVAKMRNEGATRESARTEYQSFRDGYPRVVRRIARLHQADQHTLANELEDYLTSEFLRREHGTRSREFIFAKFSDRLVYCNRPFGSELAKVCTSHTQPAEELDDLGCWELARTGGERCNWRFVALLLRLADILDFDAKRTPRVLFEHLGVRDKLSLAEWRKHLAVHAWDIEVGRIAFSAKCLDPVIEKTSRDFSKSGRR